MIIGGSTQTRKRYGAYTTDDDGDDCPGEPTESNSFGSLQPLQGERQIDDELLRLGATHRWYTRDDFRAVDPVGRLPADELIVAGFTGTNQSLNGVYRVVRVDPWTRLLAHNKVFLTRVTRATF